MSKKYWVPAIERVDSILYLIAHQPNKYRLIDISNELEINKSSLFSSLNTLEQLGWVKKENDGTYSLGTRLGILGILYFSRFDLISTFSIEAIKTVEKLNETIQLSILDGTDILYLAKKEGTSQVRIASDPGMKFPAHSTAMGKILLSQYSFSELNEMYHTKSLTTKTAHTINNLSDLWHQISFIKEKGFVWERQEAVEGFTCVAAPIINHNNEIIAAVSSTMLIDKSKEEKEKAEKLIIDLAEKISLKAGFVSKLGS